MTRTLTPEAATALQNSTVRPAGIAEIETNEGMVRVWEGVGPLAWGADTFTGVGLFGGVALVPETSDLQANGVQFQLSGVAPENVALALSSIYFGKSAKLWVGLFDETGNLIPDPVLIFAGLTDVPSLDESPDSPRISVTAENRLIDLERARTRRYTSQDQRAEYPEDKGFDYVPSLQDAQIRWGS